MKNSKNKGNIFVISGPSGVGKGTLLNKLLEKHPEISLSVSATTRNPREGEVEGVNYYFLQKPEFQRKIEQGEFLEWAEFAGNYYGTPIKPIQNTVAEGKDVILEIEVQGAMQVKDKLPDAVLIFIMPPSFDDLKSRLTNRATESQEAIEKRLSIVKSELEKVEEFDYKVINDNVDRALSELEEIIFTRRCKV